MKAVLGGLVVGFASLLIVFVGGAEVMVVEQGAPFPVPTSPALTDSWGDDSPCAVVFVVAHSCFFCHSLAAKADSSDLEIRPLWLVLGGDEQAQKFRESHPGLGPEILAVLDTWRGSRLRVPVTPVRIVLSRNSRNVFHYSTSQSVPTALELERLCEA